METPPEKTPETVRPFNLDLLPRAPVPPAPRSPGRRAAIIILRLIALCLVVNGVCRFLGGCQP